MAKVKKEFNPGDKVVRIGTDHEKAKIGHVYTIDKRNSMGNWKLVEIPGYGYDGELFVPLGKHGFLPGDIVERTSNGRTDIIVGDTYTVDALDPDDHECFSLKGHIKGKKYLSEFFKKVGEAKVSGEMTFVEKCLDDVRKDIAKLEKQREIDEKKLLKTEDQLEVSQVILKALEEKYGI